MTAVCIYCKNPITEHSIEHIIPSAFGASKKKRHIVCRKCNQEMGREFEADFLKQFNFFRVIFGVLSDDGKTAPPEKGLTTQSGVRYDLYHGGIPVLSNPEYIKQQLADGATVIGGKYRSWKEAKKHIKGFCDKGVKEIEIEFVREYLIEMLIIPAKIGGVCAFRGIGKIAFNYLATKLGSHIALSSQFDELRTYIRWGKEAKKELVYLNFLNSAFPSSEIGIIDHSVWLQKKHGDNRLFGLVRLYGSFDFICLLSEDFKEIDSYEAIYTFDPIKRVGGEHKVLPIIDIESPYSMAQIHRTTREIAFDSMKCAITKIMVRHNEFAREKRINEIVEESIAKAWATPNGRVLEDKDIQMLVDKVSREFTKVLFRLPERRKHIVKSKEDIDNIKDS